MAENEPELVVEEPKLSISEALQKGLWDVAEGLLAEGAAASLPILAEAVRVGAPLQTVQLLLEASEGGAVAAASSVLSAVTRKNLLHSIGEKTSAEGAWQCESGVTRLIAQSAPLSLLPTLIAGESS